MFYVANLPFQNVDLPLIYYCRCLTCQKSKRQKIFFGLDAKMQKNDLISDEKEEEKEEKEELEEELRKKKRRN